jgi:PIN domain nuclease of toxin-antitoxin system
MKVLLDTHAFLWWVTDDPRLSPTAKTIISDETNLIVFSVVSAWEIAIKQQVGKLALTENIESLITAQVIKNNLIILPVMLNHTL